MTEAPFFQTIINKSKVNDVLEPMQQMNAPQAIPHRDKSLKIFSLPNNRSDTESPFHDLPNSNSTYTLPRPSDTSKPNSKIRLGLRHFETAPYEGWKAIKKWARLGKQQLPKKSEPASNLMREIEANGLAPMLLAMRFKKDEKDANRIPVLLSNISVRVTKEERPSNMFKRKAKKYTTTVFKIQVDYGTGPDRMTWVVYRRYWDFVKLHYKYKTMRINKLPKFPSLPRHHFRHQKKHKKLPADNPLSSMDSMTQVPSIVDEDAVMALMAPTEENVELDIVGVDKTMLMAMEKYLNQFIAMLNPCGYTNRLCRFLEISTLGMYLAFKYPEGHHGKEGFAVLQSRSDRDPKYTRQFLQDGFVCSLPTSGGRRRRFPKWFIVRESYIICVNDPSEHEPYDVFLFDNHFFIKRLAMFGDRPKAHLDKSENVVKRKKFTNALVNASHWASGKSTLFIKNLQGIYHIRCRTEQQAKQFELSLKTMMRHTLWCSPNPYDSFAPVRKNMAATWFVDGRDYFWDVSVALDNAKETIYIHDWWLELFLRRPAAQNPEWRLDRILKRKADEGVKIYIVMYKEVAVALPLFSHLAKKHLLSLSPNIYVQRHPSRALDLFKKDNIFFWAHHEKICVVDNEIAFIGGLDLCFGRYDTPSHTVVDNTDPQVWPGKDYSNERIVDFHTLDKPFEDNLDRTTLPRMPWHDISMRLVGQSARDIARHFVQRWNLLRRKKQTAPKHPTPMILPIPDSESRIGVNDPRLCHPHTSETCQVQILRSVSPWSIGSIDHIEHSIQTAYIENIKNSQHFIYIENQFFITSTQVGSTLVENQIGQAIVDRIIRAHKEKTPWKAILMIPLIPGFPSNIDETESTTVRVIMQFQYAAFSRGPESIIGRLHAAGVTNTHQYINIYGLRNWGELNGQFVTEQVYIHAKTMIVDDRVVIMGSANINERSQLGVRDSEIAACIEDDTLISSTLNGKKVKVSKFAHTLRMRLMSEHIGLDVDRMDVEKYQGIKKKNGYFKEPAFKDFSDKAHIDCVPQFVKVASEPIPKKKNLFFDDEKPKNNVELNEAMLSPTKLSATSSPSNNSSAQNSATSEKSDLTHTMSLFNKRKSLNQEEIATFWLSLDCDTDNNDDTKGSTQPLDYYNELGLDELMEKIRASKMTVADVYQLLIDPMKDDFYRFWHIIARANALIYRRVFLVFPDNNVRTWEQYTHFNKMSKLLLGRQDIKHGGTSNTTAAANVCPQDPEGTLHAWLHKIQGQLVIWPTHFLEEADAKNEFLSNVDKIVPVEIFN